MKTSKSLISIIVLSVGFISAASAEHSLAEAVAGGEFHVNFRLRFEDVEQNTPTGDIKADALTLRTRLNYKTASYKNLTGFIEIDDNTAISDVDYRTWPGDANNAGTAIIADPEGTEVNQFWLNLHLNDNDIKWGRQRIALDNHRFIGTVGWRQNEQTYDALSVVSAMLDKTSISVGHIYNVNRIFGESVVVGDVEHDSYYINIKNTALPIGALTAYAYLIDAEDNNAAFETWDNNTYGLRLSGQQEVDQVVAHYTLEYAKQSDSHDNPASYDANYWLIEGGVKVSGVKLTIAQEVLGADGSDGFFVTPFATLHKFQGWTDKFLNLGKGNISGGIVDRYFSVGGVCHGIKLLAVYHDFKAEDDNVTGNSDLGEEWGFLVGKQFSTSRGKTYGLTLKYASYSEGDLQNGDTDKLWLMATANF